MNRKTLAALLTPAVLAGGAVATSATTAANTAAPRAQAAKVTIHLAASKTKLRFSPSKFTVAHGTITLVMSNPSRKDHSIAVDGHGIDKSGRTVSKGGTSTVKVKLKANRRYTFYCSVEDHRALGMKGSIVVT